jgi:hypothetical protein
MPWRSGFLLHQHRRSVCRPATYSGHAHPVVASMFCKSCNCNSSIATRIGFAASLALVHCVLNPTASIQIIFILNSLLAWLMKTPFAIRKIEEWSYDYIKMECEEGKCYGVLAVRPPRLRLCPSFLHTIPLGSSTLFRIIPLPLPFESIPHRCDRIKG